MAGLYISRSEILVGKIDQMSREEVLAEIAKLQSQFPILIDQTAPTIDMISARRDAEELPDYVTEEDRQRLEMEIDE